MELRHLRYFVRVAETLHFGRAARALGISQPPLSQQIRALEAELGVELFDRTSRRVQLTEAGRVFLPEARRTLEQAAHAADVARRAQQGETGELAIGFAPSAPFTPPMAHALAAYRARWPSIHLSLAEMSRDAQLAALQAGRLDLGFVRGFDPPALAPGVSATKLLEEPLLVALNEAHPLTARGVLGIADIADEPFVLYQRDMGAGVNEHIALLFRRAGREFRVAQEVSGLASLLGLVAAGFGVTVLVSSLAAVHADRVVYRPLAEADAVSRLWLVRRERMSGAARRFAELLDGAG